MEFQSEDVLPTVRTYVLHRNCTCRKSNNIINALPPSSASALASTRQDACGRMKVVITGGLGFVGRQVARRILALSGTATNTSSSAAAGTRSPTVCGTPVTSLVLVDQPLSADAEAAKSVTLQELVSRYCEHDRFMRADLAALAEDERCSISLIDIADKEACFDVIDTDDVACLRTSK